ncbi:hypothetical protein BGY98DRAFT_1098225 [Russula aff. rugulosa BPL654]|nr:hypothetical protein BGY98DRAFT_1098225 [Russula aff. rugulosa BPL654]
MVSICPLRVEELAEIIAIQFDEEALPYLTQIDVQHMQKKRLCPSGADPDSMTISAGSTSLVVTGWTLMMTKSSLEVTHLLVNSGTDSTSPPSPSHHASSPLPTLALTLRVVALTALTLTLRVVALTAPALTPCVVALAACPHTTPAALALLTGGVAAFNISCIGHGTSSLFVL